jgi:hypothetical protein
LISIALSHGAVTTLWPVSAAVQWEDVGPWLSCIEPLSHSMFAHDWLLIGGDFAQAALRLRILS